MGDAVRDGDVPAELEDTIDAQASKSEPAPAGLPVEIIAATRDYKELLAVDRHHYAITREIAHGGIGRVFEARDLRLGRQVAIKELLPKNRDAARRFEREARITARLQHPSIIHVYEAGLWPGGEPFYAMPLVAGRSLDKVVAEKKSLPERLALLPHVIAAADALAYAHNANVIHRDLKPANVLVGEFGETVVIDWGLAKDLGTYTDPKESLQMRLRATGEETVSGSVVGTPAYMPPEQARGDAVDQRADVYALGALLYKVLCGAAPYAGKNAGDVLEQVKAGPPVPLQEREPDAPPDLLAIVAKAMARDVDARYITASELAADLKRFETGQLVGAHRYTTGELVRRWLRRHRVAVSIAAIAALVLITVGVFSLQRIVTEKSEAQHAGDVANLQRRNLLEERGRTELLDGHAGVALAYLFGAADGAPHDAARDFLLADAMRPFEAEVTKDDVGGVAVVAVSADGTRLAMAGSHGVWLRRLDSPLTKLVKIAAPAGTHVVAFDPTATKIVAAGDDGVARVWTVDGAPVAELHAHSGAIRAATFTRDGARLVTAGNDGTVRVWTLATRQHADVPCHVGAIVSARLSPDGDKVVTASEDSTACIINIAEVEPISPGTLIQLKGHKAPLNDATWSPDGTLVATASDDGTARVWSAKTGKPVVDALKHEPGTRVLAVALSSDGLVVTGGSDLVVRVWELPNVLGEEGAMPPTVRLPRRLAGHTGRITRVAISPDESRLLTAGADGVAKLWDLHTGQEIGTFEHGDAVSSVAFVPNHALLATGSVDGAARTWTTEEGETLSDLDSAIKALAIVAEPAGDALMVAAAREDSVVTLLHRANKRDGSHADLAGHVGRVLAVAFTPDGKRLVSGGEDAAAIVWDPIAGRRVDTLGSYQEPIHAIAIAHDAAAAEDRVAMLVGGGIDVWSLQQRRRLQRLDVAGHAIDALAINPTTLAVAGVARDGTFQLWSAGGTPLRASPIVHDGSFTAVAFSPAGDALVAAGSKGAHVWHLDPFLRATLDTRLVEGDVGEVNAVAITQDGARVITAGDTGHATIWDRNKGKVLHTRGRHQQAINTLALVGDALWLGSDDHMLSAWNIRSETSLAHVSDVLAGVPWKLDRDNVVRKQ